MAAQKKPQPELIAIYRLEFYKKQKNWKLSADTRKFKELQNTRPIPAVKNTVKLNETYSVESNVEDEASVLNEAFLKDESDKEPTSSSSLSLCKQSLEPIHACHECLQAGKPQNPWADYVDDVDGWAGAAVVARGNGDGNEFEGFDGWAEGMVWTNSAMPQEWTGDVLASQISQPGSGCPQLCAADDLLHQHLELEQLAPWPDDQLWVPDIWRDEELLSQSLESEEEFMVGAHGAPHSSEVELAGTAELDACGSAARLSGAALAAAVRRHTGSLRRLLREAGRRRSHRSTLSLDPCVPDEFGLGPRDFFNTEYSCDIFPTRDVPTPLSPPCPYNDRFTPISPANLSKGSLTPLNNVCKDQLTAISTNNFCSGALELSREGRFTPLSPTNQTNPCTPRSPASLYRDGFLAGSHRNKVPLGFIELGRGRGRGRL